MRTQRHKHAPCSGPEPGDSCKHCGAELTWTGPGAQDFIAVARSKPYCNPVSVPGPHPDLGRYRGQPLPGRARPGRSARVRRGHRPRPTIPRDGDDLGEDIILEIVDDLVSDLMHLAASEGIDPPDANSYQVHCSQHGPVALGLRDRTDALTVQQQHLDTFHHPTDRKDEK